jgi:large subunit ribosomal protein L15
MDLKTLHALPSIKKRPARKRVGRGPGSGMGKTSTRGQKGAGSRSGWRTRDFYEGGQTPLMRRIPKRGFSNDPFATRLAVLNVTALNRFPDGAEVDPRALAEAGLVKQPEDGVKILGDGDLARKLTVKAHRFSKSAMAKIEAKGGKCVTLLPPRGKKPEDRKRSTKPLPSKAGGASPKSERQAKGEPKPRSDEGGKPAPSEAETGGAPAPAKAKKPAPPKAEGPAAAPKAEGKQKGEEAAE